MHSFQGMFANLLFPNGGMSHSLQSLIVGDYKLGNLKFSLNIKMQDTNWSNCCQAPKSTLPDNTYYHLMTAPKLLFQGIGISQHITSALFEINHNFTFEFCFSCTWNVNRSPKKHSLYANGAIRMPRCYQQFRNGKGNNEGR